MPDRNSQNCGCQKGPNQWVGNIYQHLSEANAPLAMSYVPYQSWETPYEPCTALKEGTVFQSLCKPFCGKGGKCW
ncbi:MAG: spore coat associated protein CotJA [Lachnospiraceae bacterium]|nr:spore coat associated protein CotJA [Lachnospiraceae bacterium]